MKILIAYCSKTGTSEDAAKYIAKKFDNVTLVNLSQRIPNFNQYDKIILGSGIYFKRLYKDLLSVIEKNKAILLSKKFAIFYCCANLQPKKIQEIKDKNFDDDIKRKSMIISCVGGKLNLSRAKFPKSVLLFLRIQYYKILNRDMPQLDTKKLDEFCEMINSISL